MFQRCLPRPRSSCGPPRRNVQTGVEGPQDCPPFSRVALAIVAFDPAPSPVSFFTVPGMFVRGDRWELVRRPSRRGGPSSQSGGKWRAEGIVAFHDDDDDGRLLFLPTRSILHQTTHSRGNGATMRLVYARHPGSIALQRMFIARVGSFDAFNDRPRLRRRYG
jgi:hypothetical protein